MSYKFMSSLTAFSLLAIAVFADNATNSDADLFNEIEVADTSTPPAAPQPTQPSASSSTNSDSLVIIAVEDDSNKTSYPNRVNTVYAAEPYLSNGIHMDMNVDYLFWTSGVNETMYGCYGNDNNSIANRTYLDLSREWASAFRVGVGYSFAAQGWDVQASYTRFVNNAHSSQSYPTNGDSIYLTWANRNVTLDAADTTGGVQKGSWHLNFQEVDGTFGKELFFSKYFSMRPSAGVRYIHVKDHLNVTNTASTTSNYANIEQKNTLNAFGFQFGLNSSYHFGYGISLEAKGAVALVYGSKHITYDSSQLSSGVSSGFIAKQNADDLLPAFDAGLSLNWKDSFMNDSFALGASLGYEYHAIVDGFTPITLGESAGITQFIHQSATLYMHGLVASVNFSF